MHAMRRGAKGLMDATRKGAKRMDREAILVTLRRACATDLLACEAGLEDEGIVKLAPGQLRCAAEALVAQHGLRHLSAITGLRREGGLEVLYHFWDRGGLTLRVTCPRGIEALPSLVDLLPVADWYEREVHDLFGLRFDGHPNLAPLVLPEDWDGPPPLAGEEAEA